MMAQAFQFLPGEKLLWVVGMPGPDYDDCEVVSQNGSEVTINYRVWGGEKIHTKTVHWSELAWKIGSETSNRYNEWRKTHPHEDD